MAWRLANSLVTLRNQVNAMYPNRSKISDGTIGDAAHQSEGSASDHNPWLPGEVVSALDLTHDPANGLDIDKFSDVLVASGDPRIKYIIANRQIWQRSTGWLGYSGSNPHTQHVHISVNTHNYDDGSNWNLNEGGSMTIGSGENFRARMNRFHHQLVRNADMSDEVFRNIQGKDGWTVLESWSDHPESNKLLQYQVVGEVATRDNWPGQIYSLQDTVKSLSTRPSKEELQSALDQVQKITTELAVSRDEALVSREKIKELEAQKTEDTKLLDDAGSIFTRFFNRWFKK